MVQPSMTQKHAPVQFSVKDGLPVFPAIELTVQGAGNALPAESMTLEDQIKKANNQAAELMAKGRDALQVGEMFAAIDPNHLFAGMVRKHSTKECPAQSRI